MLPHLLALGFIGQAFAANLTEVLAAHTDQLSTLNDTISRIPEAVQQLSLLRNVTLFAPSNNAFKQLAKQNPNFTAMDTTAVSNLLLYHIVPSPVLSTMFNTTPVFVPTLLTLTGDNIPTGPSATQKVGLKLAGATNTSATIFSGFKQASTVITPDLAFDGGILHIIDTVLTLPGTPSATALDTAGLTSFYGALNKTSLLAGVDALQDATIFAPSNAAFEAVGSVMNAASVATLKTVLQYHVLKESNLPGMAMFSPALIGSAPAAATTGLRETMQLSTLTDGNVTVREDVATSDLFINSAGVVTSDIITSNGVIHIIDNVLNPQAADAVPTVAAVSQAPAFTGAMTVSEAPFTSGVAATTTLTPAAATGAADVFAAVPTAALMAGGVAAIWANM